MSVLSGVTTDGIRYPLDGIDRWAPAQAMQELAESVTTAQRNRPLGFLVRFNTIQVQPREWQTVTQGMEPSFPLRGGMQQVGGGLRVPRSGIYLLRAWSREESAPIVHQRALRIVIDGQFASGHALSTLASTSGAEALTNDLFTFLPVNAGSVIEVQLHHTLNSVGRFQGVALAAAFLFPM